MDEISIKNCNLRSKYCSIHCGGNNLPWASKHAAILPQRQIYVDQSTQGCRSNGFVAVDNSKIYNNN